MRDILLRIKTQASDAITKNFKRFPITMVVTIIWTLFMIYMSHFGDFKGIFQRILYPLSIAFPLIFGLEILFHDKKNRIKYTALFLGFLFICYYFYQLPENIRYENVHQNLKFFLLLLTLSAFIYIAPYFRRDYSSLSLYGYQYRLTANLVITSFFTSTLLILLNVALFAIDRLFDIHIDPEIYADIAIITTGIFASWHFLYNFPTKEELEINRENPKWLDMFSKYILISIVILYALILFFYALKIVLTQNWPRGWVSTPIIIFSLLGNISFIIIAFGNKLSKSSKGFQKLFHIINIPFLLMLFTAIFRRVFDYGLTESRILVILIGLWFFSIAVYYIFSQKKNLAFYGLSFSLILLIATLSPINIFNVSKNNQTRLLKKLLVKNNLLVDNMLVPTKEKLSFDENKQICSILNYLARNYSLQHIENVFPDSLKKEINEDMNENRYWGNSSGKVISYLNIKSISPYQKEEYNYFNFSLKEPLESNIEDYSHFAALNINYNQVANINFKNIKIEYSKEDYMLKIYKEDILLQSINLLDFVTKLNDEISGNNPLPIEKLTIESRDFKIIFQSINGELGKNQYIYANGFIFIR